MIYDLIIIGLGPSGVSAAIYAKRANLNVLCFESLMVGGYLNFIDKIENYPGLYNTTGPDFAMNLYNTLKDLNINIENKKITSIKEGEIKEIYTNDSIYKTKNIIIATGRSPRNLGLANEEKLIGHGISHCALCDGAFYKNKDVAVVGGGNSALQEALYLSNICNHVYLIHRRDNFRTTGLPIKQIEARENITVIKNASIVEIKEENNKIKEIILNNGQNLEISGLFTYIGFIPNTDFVSHLNITDKEGYITVDNNYETKIKGIYAIGDIVKKDIYQITTAVSDGTIAASHIIDELNK